MMIISHRGYWLTEIEKNSQQAFERSFSLGFGIETDIRDHDNRLVISHDPATAGCLPVERLFELYSSFAVQLPLALNIKADGLQAGLKNLLEKYNVNNYFLFDMAVPDALQYLQKKMTTYTRQSEYEIMSAYYPLAQGVWLDEFDGHWITEQVIEKHLREGKRVCIVSPELHKRTHQEEWSHYRDIEAKIGNECLMLCTDFPEQAREFFNDQNKSNYL